MGNNITENLQSSLFLSPYTKKTLPPYDFPNLEQNLLRERLWAPLLYLFNLMPFLSACDGCNKREPRWATLVDLS